MPCKKLELPSLGFGLGKGWAASFEWNGWPRRRPEEEAQSSPDSYCLAGLLRAARAVRCQPDRRSE